MAKFNIEQIMSFYFFKGARGRYEVHFHFYYCFIKIRIPDARNIYNNSNFELLLLHKIISYSNRKISTITLCMRTLIAIPQKSDKYLKLISYMSTE